MRFGGSEDQVKDMYKDIQAGIGNVPGRGQTSDDVPT